MGKPVFWPLEWLNHAKSLISSVEYHPKWHKYNPKWHKYNQNGKCFTEHIDEKPLDFTGTPFLDQIMWRLNHSLRYDYKKHLRRSRRGEHGEADRPRSTSTPSWNGCAPVSGCTTACSETPGLGRTRERGT